MSNYEITVTSSTYGVLFRAHGQRKYGEWQPTGMMDELGNRWAGEVGAVTVCYHNLTEGWRAEKDYR